MNPVRARMTHRCNVERDTSIVDNNIGARNPPNWVVQYADQPCFYFGLLFQRQGRELITEMQGEAISEFGVMIPLGTDITAEDRINGITDRGGTVLVGGLINIKSILYHHTHMELKLERVN